MNRAATEQEVKDALYRHSLRNPDSDGQALLDKALGEGYKNEVCAKCDTVFLAFHHFVMCGYEDCPMKGKDSRSILDQLRDEVRDAMKPDESVQDEPERTG